MRKLIFSILLATAAASPALAQDQGRWHKDEAKSDRAAAHEQHAEQQQQQAPRVQVQQEQRGGSDAHRFEGRNTGGAQPQVQQQQAVQQQQFNRGERSGFDARQREQTQQWQGQQAVQSQQWQGRTGVQSQQWQGRTGVQSPQWQGRTGSNGQRSWSQSGQASQGSRWSGNWNRNWRNDNRYDWRSYRNSHRSLFSVGIYYDPFGYGYQSYDIGYQLPPAYFGRQYWIDPAMYELPYPPPGTTWVRYWNDALLVDMYTGQVVDVIHDFFW